MRERVEAAETGNTAVVPDSLAGTSALDSREETSELSHRETAFLKDPGCLPGSKPA